MLIEMAFLLTAYTCAISPVACIINLTIELPKRPLHQTATRHDAGIMGSARCQDEIGGYFPPPVSKTLMFQKGRLSIFSHLLVCDRASRHLDAPTSVNSLRLEEGLGRGCLCKLSEVSPRDETQGQIEFC